MTHVQKLDSPSLAAPEHDREKASSEKPEDDPAPEGGLRAWLVAAGGAAILFSTLGFANSFGTFEAYYATHQMRGESPSKIAWIGSLSMFLQFFAGLVGGPLFDRFGAMVRLARCTETGPCYSGHGSYVWIKAYATDVGYPPGGSHICLRHDDA